MISDITFGQYIPGKSSLHKLDPRVKTLLTIAMIVVTFLANSYISVAIILISTMLLIFLSGIPMRSYFKSIKFILFIALFTSIMNLLYGSGEALVQFAFFKITATGVKNTLVATTRLLSLIMVSSALTFTTSPNDLTIAIEHLITPLKLLKVDVRSIAMMMTIALRFVPTIIGETQKIMNAQKARGANFETGSLISRAKALIPIIVPLFVSSFKRAFELATAMECRCYQSGNKVTHMKTLKVSILDFIAIIAIIILYIGVILCNHLEIS